MRVVIDPERCQGHGRCYSLAPSIFAYDELGQGLVIGEGILTEETLPLARLAESNCPEHAISLEPSIIEEQP